MIDILLIEINFGPVWHYFYVWPLKKRGWKKPESKKNNSHISYTSQEAFWGQKKCVGLNNCTCTTLCDIYWSWCDVFFGSTPASDRNTLRPWPQSWFCGRLAQNVPCAIVYPRRDSIPPPSPHNHHWNVTSVIWYGFPQLFNATYIVTLLVHCRHLYG